MKRNFLVKNLPPITLENFNPKRFIEGYFYGVEMMKIRNIDDKYYLIISTPNEDVNINITEKNFNTIKDKFDIQLFKKTSYEIPLTAKIIINLNVYDDNDIKIAEIYFENEKEAKEFIPPRWFGEEFIHKTNQVKQKTYKKD